LTAASEEEEEEEKAKVGVACGVAALDEELAGFNEEEGNEEEEDEEEDDEEEELLPLPFEPSSSGTSCASDGGCASGGSSIKFTRLGKSSSKFLRKCRKTLINSPYSTVPFCITVQSTSSFAMRCLTITASLQRPWPKICLYVPAM